MRSTITLTPRHLQAVRMHAASTYPNECCGFLLGRASEDLHQVHRVLPARNEHSEPRRRFLISPETVLAARREARALGLEVVGYYHSHTDGGAEPSARDLEAAWPAVSYLIVPVSDGVAGRPRSWRLRTDGDGFVEETVVRPGERPRRPDEIHSGPDAAPGRGEVRP